MKVGIPPVHQGAKLSKTVELQLRGFINKAVIGFDSVLSIFAPNSSTSYRAGAALAEMALDQRISVSVMGFRALLSVYKNSFREPEAKELIRDKFNYSDIIVFANVSDDSFGAWSDRRDLEWLQSMLRQRASMQKKTVFCVDESFSFSEFTRLLGPGNERLYERGVLQSIKVTEKDML